MVRVASALIDDLNFRSTPPYAATYVADVELSMAVAAFTELIHPVLEERHTFPIHKLTLYLAQKEEDDAWPSYFDVRQLRPTDVERANTFMEPTKLLSECLGSTFQPPDKDEVHVLVVCALRICFAVMAPFDQKPQDQMAQVLASAHRTGALPRSLGDADADLWSADDCGNVKDLTPWREILPSLPPAFFVRLEALMVWRVFRENFQQRLDTENDLDVTSVAYKAIHGQKLRGFDCLSLKGSPGVGKKMLLTLMCMWLAVKQKRDVLLLRYVDWELRATLLAGKTGRYYEWQCCDFGLWRRENRWDRACHFVDLLKQVNKPERVWVCVDSVTHAEFHNSFRGVNFDMWCASGEVVMSATHCLVPFWTQRDLKAVGKLRGFDDEECARRYAVSGGSLSQFLQSIEDAKRFIDAVLEEPAWDSISDLRKIQAGYRQLVFMHTVVDRASLKHYVEESFQREVLTSEYAKQRIGLCEEVWGIFRRRYERDGLVL